MISNDHNVYVLGAGFSFDAGIPIVAAFMNRMRDAHPWLVSKQRETEANAVERVVAFRLASAGAAHRVKIDVENIEELFSLASSSAGVSGELDESDVRLAIAATIDFAAELGKSPHCELGFEPGTAPTFDWPVSPDRKSSPGERSWRLLSSYDFVVGVMVGAFGSPNPARRNTIISFNYDMIVERALAKVGVPFSYGFEGKTVAYGDDSPGVHGTGTEHVMRLLKLHGSVNWAVPGGPGGKLRVFKDYSAVRAEECVPTLVPPTWRKTFANQLDHVWSECVSALNSATRVIVIGFSMPRTDTHFKYLLGAGLQRNVSLRDMVFVDPRAAHVDARAEEVLEVDHLRGVLRVEPETAATFFLEAAHRERIGRALAAGAYYCDDELPRWAREGLTRALAGTPDGAARFSGRFGVELG